MFSGLCLCGSISYTVEGEPLWVAYCHCQTCRRHAASPVALFVGVRAEQARWTGEQTAVYNSSPDVERLFCARCGTPVAYRSDRFPREIHFYHGTLDRPEELPPRGHVHVAEQLPWFDVHDELPRYETTGEGGAKPVRIGPRKSG